MATNFILEFSLLLLNHDHPRRRRLDDDGVMSTSSISVSSFPPLFSSHTLSISTMQGCYHHQRASTPSCQCKYIWHNGSQRDAGPKQMDACYVIWIWRLPGDMDRSTGDRISGYISRRHAHTPGIASTLHEFTPSSQPSRDPCLGAIILAMGLNPSTPLVTVPTVSVAS
ncbi:uncharacterized protein ARMOST_18853 [Armillaria ostoyae]|uniref:Uncharacterized protein n=1 Tax=Armillaria ostoyae TaxID=47428 RepID=A0A284S2X4_ARMOS|nr:uncharacterized protein ARMOST_18853 [Armillaria ostoyae]